MTMRRDCVRVYPNYRVLGGRSLACPANTFSAGNGVSCAACAAGFSTNGLTGLTGCIRTCILSPIMIVLTLCVRERFSPLGVRVWTDSVRQRLYEHGRRQLHRYGHCRD
jgi:hypothetical protein